MVEVIVLLFVATGMETHSGVAIAAVWKYCVARAREKPVKALASTGFSVWLRAHSDSNGGRWFWRPEFYH